MPNRLQTILHSLKSRFNDILFGSGGGMYTVGRSGRRYPSPNSSIDWEKEVGDLRNVPAVQAILNFIIRNLSQCPPCVETPGADGEYEPVPDTLLVELLLHPNDEWDWWVMLYAIVADYLEDGNAYLPIERMNSGGLPTELYYLPAHIVTPKRDKKTGEIFYEYKIKGATQRIEASEMVHIRHGVDKYNTLRGVSPIASSVPDCAILQRGMTYSAKAMKNGGMIGTVISPKQLPDGMTVDVDTKEIQDLWVDHATGDDSGKPFVNSIPIDVQYPNVTPQSMAIDTILDRPESDICALLGIPPQVVGLHVGRLSKTYANMKEAREAAWEEGILPIGYSIYGQIGTTLLPQMSANADNERLTMDIRDVRPLQPDLDALFTRANDCWDKNLIDREQWKIMVGMKPLPGDKGVFKQDTLPEPILPDGTKPPKDKPIASK